MFLYMNGHFLLKMTVNVYIHLYTTPMSCISRFPHFQKWNSRTFQGVIRDKIIFFKHNWIVMWCIVNVTIQRYCKSHTKIKVIKIHVLWCMDSKFVWNFKGALMLNHCHITSLTADGSTAFILKLALPLARKSCISIILHEEHMAMVPHPIPLMNMLMDLASLDKVLPASD